MGGLGFSSFEVGEEDERICVQIKACKLMQGARGGKNIRSPTSLEILFERSEGKVNWNWC